MIVVEFLIAVAILVGIVMTILDPKALVPAPQ